MNEKQTKITANDQEIVSLCLIPFQSATKQGGNINTED